MKYTIHISILLLLCFTSCFKKEDAIILPIGSSEITTVFLGENYTNEVYFDLGTNTYQQKTLADWDLRFQSGSNEFGIFLNNGTDIMVYKIGIFNLDEPVTVDTIKIIENKELYDFPEGKIEHSAIGDWRTYKSGTKPGIYVIKLKYEQGYKRFKRLQILEYNDTAYFVSITDLFEPDNVTQIKKGDTLVIPKCKEQNYTYYSFKNGGSGRVVLNAEPEKNSWDFVFTRYKHIFYGILPNNEPFPYVLTGVLSNPNKVSVAKDSATFPFKDIDATTLPMLNFSTDWNVIGYDWKTHAFGAAGNYTVNPNISYIIQDTDGAYYKLHFLDFYNPKGEKGYPKFEFVRIK